MSRRVLLGLLALILLLLVLVVLPLGWETAVHYRSDYANTTLSQARALASVAEERLSDDSADAGLRHDLLRYVDSGQGVVLLGPAGTIVDTAGLRFTVPPGLTASTKPFTATLGPDGARLVVASVPIVGEGGRVGTVVVARPNHPLAARIRTLWLTLAAAATLAALAAVLLAWWLSGWVTRPLRRLEEAAHQVGSGDLEARASVVHGPPEVRRLAAAFDTMATRLNTLLEGHRAVIADVSHQLRTPMSALRLRLELLPQLGAQGSQERDQALDEVNRLSRLVDGLLAVARADVTSQPPTPVDVRAVVTERVSAWTPLGVERGVDLALASGPAVRAWAVRDELEQILDNLLANCFDLDPAPEQVLVSVTVAGDDAIVSVTDNGPGMPASQREHAFQRFTTGRADSGGNGLGLAIVHRMTTAMGGRVVLDETSGGGLTVRFTLPRAVSRPATGAASRAGSGR